MKIKIDGGIFLDKSHTGRTPRFLFFEGPASSQRSFMEYEFVCTAKAEGEAPEGFNPDTALLDALRAQKKELHDKFASAVMEIDQRINSLLAIENAP